MWVWVGVGVCVCERENERERENAATFLNPQEPFLWFLYGTEVFTSAKNSFA